MSTYTHIYFYMYTYYIFEYFITLYVLYVYKYMRLANLVQTKKSYFADVGKIVGSTVFLLLSYVLLILTVWSIDVKC